MSCTPKRRSGKGLVVCSTRVERTAGLAVWVGLLVVLGAAACSAGTATSPSAAGSVRTAPSSDRGAELDGAVPTSEAGDAAAELDGADAAAVYDLEADRDRRVHAAEQDLGTRAAARKIAAPFVLAGPSSAAIHGAEPFIEAVLGAYRNQRFGRSPERAISIYVFPAVAAYHAYCRRVYGGSECMSRFGFYEPDERRIVMQGGAGGTLSHELAHPFYEADFPTGPTWLNEGIASVFEQPILHPKGEIHGGKNWRLPRLLAALSSPKERAFARIDALFSMTDETFRGALESLHYATARYTCQWLDERGKLWPFYHAYRDGVAADPTGEKAFTAVVGQSPADATRSWHRWLRAL